MPAKFVVLLKLKSCKFNTVEANKECCANYILVKFLTG
jgi:hypothetical protein